VDEREAQLAWERRFARPAAVAALAALALGIAAQVLSATTANRNQGGERGALLNLNEHASQAIAATLLQVLSVWFLAAVLYYLLRCVRHRRPESVPAAIQPLIVLAPLLVTVGGVMSELDVIDIADRFAAEGARTEARADDLLEERTTFPVFIGFGGNIAFGFCLVMVNLHSMRVGLMTRFVGIIGIVVGALYVLPVFAGPLILQVFWLGALVAILIDRWPGGRGEAWETGEAGVWLSAAELRRQQMREQRTADAPPEMLEQPEPEDLESRPHPVSKKKRRRKRNQ
jgi:hypothetical protein